MQHWNTIYLSPIPITSVWEYIPCEVKEAPRGDNRGVGSTWDVMSFLTWQYLSLSCWARCPSSTTGLSRDLARASQEGLGSIRFNQSIHISLRQSGARGKSSLMIFSVPRDNLSSIPITYHLVRASNKALITSDRFSNPSCPEGIIYICQMSMICNADTKHSSTLLWF